MPRINLIPEFTPDGTIVFRAVVRRRKERLREIVRRLLRGTR